MMQRLCGSTHRHALRLQRARIHTTHGPMSTRKFYLSYLGAGAAAGAAFSYFEWRMGSNSRMVRLDSLSQRPEPSLHSSATPSSHPPPSDHNNSAPETPNVIIDKSEEAETENTEADEESETGAFNPVTGEINWDCPCLGGMAHGICGAQFREAFSCFVYSEEEPKGINCVEKFKAMQDCFREHPDVYGEEIMDEDEGEHADEIPAQTAMGEGVAPLSSEVTEPESSQVPSPQANSPET